MVNIHIKSCLLPVKTMFTTSLCGLWFSLVGLFSARTELVLRGLGVKLSHAIPLTKKSWSWQYKRIQDTSRQGPSSYCLRETCIRLIAVAMLFYLDSLDYKVRLLVSLAHE